jgi:F0F1-type ATP synthase membrane subunit b/b'
MSVTTAVIVGLAVLVVLLVGMLRHARRLMHEEVERTIDERAERIERDVDDHVRRALRAVQQITEARENLDTMLSEHPSAAGDDERE